MSTDALVADSLNDIISTCLGGPRGDPDIWHHRAAAKAFVVLKVLNLPIENEEARCCGLRNLPYKPGTREEEPGNLYGIDFLTEAGWPIEAEQDE